jgi:hypothetical protein
MHQKNAMISLFGKQMGERGGGGFQKLSEGSETFYAALCNKLIKRSQATLQCHYVLLGGCKGSCFKQFSYGSKILHAFLGAVEMFEGG